MQPDFSIVIPTRRRTGQLASCLEAFARLHWPSDRHEVIVVDDGSDSHLDPRILRMRERFALTLVAQPHGGPAVARNRGATLARGRYLAFTDDDCLPEPGWLQALARHFEAAPDAAVGGRTVNALPDDPCATASQDLIAFLYGWYNADPHRARFFASNNLAFPADGFRQIGGFASAWRLAAAEDRELCDRWLAHGGTMRYADDAIVAHAHAMTLRAFLRQHYTYGRGATWLRRTREARGAPPLRVEPPRFYRDLVAYPLRTQRGIPALRAMALMALTQVAHTAGFLREQLTTPSRDATPAREPDDVPAPGRAAPARIDRDSAIAGRRERNHPPRARG